ncbi:hypothetical protein [Salipiger sp.]|uniref:hypothetical protein n=1 Tax=Salipiger sp. TaxID=2078585 RepID=UPI003A97FEFE
MAIFGVAAKVIFSAVAQFEHPLKEQVRVFGFLRNSRIRSLVCRAPIVKRMGVQLVLVSGSQPALKATGFQRSPPPQYASFTANMWGI